MRFIQLIKTKLFWIRTIQYIIVSAGTGFGAIYILHYLDKMEYCGGETSRISLYCATNNWTLYIVGIIAAILLLIAIGKYATKNSWLKSFLVPVILSGIFLGSLWLWAFENDLYYQYQGAVISEMSKEVRLCKDDVNCKGPKKWRNCYDSRMRAELTKPYTLLDRYFALRESVTGAKFGTCIIY